MIPVENHILVGEKTSKSNRSLSLSSNKKRSLVLLLIVLLAILVQSLWYSYPYLAVGLAQLPELANLKWAHDERLLHDFLLLCGMAWFVFAITFIVARISRRILRRLMGKPWRLQNRDQIRMMHVAENSLSLKFLKYSCIYFSFVLLFAIFQYPLQFVIFTS